MNWHDKDFPQGQDYGISCVQIAIVQIKCDGIQFILCHMLITKAPVQIYVITTWCVKYKIMTVFQTPHSIVEIPSSQNCLWIIEKCHCGLVGIKLRWFQRVWNMCIINWVHWSGQLGQLGQHHEVGLSSLNCWNLTILILFIKNIHKKLWLGL